MLPFTLAGFEIQHIASQEALLMITAQSVSLTGVCPACGEASTHIHSSYSRSPHDLPVSGQQVRLVLRVRRFRCLNPNSQRQTFAERLPELPRSARQTRRSGRILESLAVVFSAQAGARLATQLAMPVSPDTLLRRVKKPSVISPPTPRVPGGDDFAFRRGHTYGTLLLDLETHRPVDLLADRAGETLAEWPRQHPGVEIISRDRSKDDAWGANAGPLWRELRERGFTGSRMMVYRWIQVQRDEPASVSVLEQKQANRTPRRLAPRHLAWLDLA